MADIDPKLFAPHNEQYFHCYLLFARQMITFELRQKRHSVYK